MLRIVGFAFCISAILFDSLCRFDYDDYVDCLEISNGGVELRSSVITAIGAIRFFGPIIGYRIVINPVFHTDGFFRVHFWLVPPPSGVYGRHVP